MCNHFSFIRVARKYVRVDHSDILYIEAMGSYSKVFTEKESFITLVMLKEWEQTLPEQVFARISKSHIVYLPKVKSFDGVSVMINGKKLGLSQMRKRELFTHSSVLGQADIKKYKQALVIT